MTIIIIIIGDVSKYHARYIVNITTMDEKIDNLQLQGQVRLAVTVKKHLLYAIVLDNHDVRYFGVERAVFDTRSDFETD